MKTSVLAGGVLGVIPTAAAGSSGVTTQTVDVFGQGPDGPVVAEDGATLRRTKNGVSMSVSMPTPEPGTYTYPSGPKGGAWTNEEGHPEVFTLWCFVFDPAQEPFNPPQAQWTGVYAVAGHAVGGPNLTLSGSASTNQDPFMGSPIATPAEAEVHLAVAPHGALTPELLPEALRTPTGPGPDVWWIAIFEPPN